MIGHSGKTHRHPVFSTLLRASGVLAVCASVVAFSDAVQAQGVNGVVVDLSVISDGGVGGGGGPLAGDATLRLPKAGRVRSQLHVAPKAKVTLRAPSAAPKAKPKMAAKPAAKPKAVAKAAPKAAPAPPPMPKPKVKTAKVAPPPAPKAPTKVAAAPAPPPAPKTMKAPPPMPKTTTAPPAPQAAPAPQTAAAPADVSLKPGRALQVVFGETATTLPDSAKPGLDALANAMRESKDHRLQLMAYAGASGLSTSKARRLSLTRALEVRSFLIDNGVRSTQIDVRALGNKTSEKPVNRVDINVAKR